MLTTPQIERYSRQIILPQVGGRGQERLLSASVGVVGVGEIAAMSALYLAAAGIGELILSNEDAESMAATLTGMNPDCRITVAGASGRDGVDLVRTAAVVIESASGPSPSSLANRACVAFARPLLWGRASGSLGHAAALVGTHGDAPCFQCLHWPRVTNPGADPSALLEESTGAFIGSLLATDAVKIILGLDQSRRGRLLTYDALAASVHEVELARDPACAVCGPGRSAGTAAVR